MNNKFIKLKKVKIKKLLGLAILMLNKYKSKFD